MGDIAGRELKVILAYLVARSGIATLLGLLVGSALYLLITELNGTAPNAALTALLGAIVGYIGNSLQQVIAALSAPVLDYLKDRLGTRGKVEDEGGE